MKKNLLLLVFSLSLLCLVSKDTLGQSFFRIKADFSIKEKMPDGKSNLVVGTVYYDQTINKIVYDISFPEKETVIMVDTFMVRLHGDGLVDKKVMPNTNRFSVFNLCLNGNLTNYGLKDSKFQISNVEKDKGLVITTWEPPEQLAKLMGKTMLSQKDKKLDGIIFFDPYGTVVGKQFFRKYEAVSGLVFPTEMVQVTEKEGQEFYKVTSFKNIVVNAMDQDNMYNHRVP